MAKPMILIADDEAQAADILGIFLEMSLPGATVCVTHGGQEALEQASRQRPDIAVIDIEMPGMDGQALAHALRALYPDPAPLLIASRGVSYAFNRPPAPAPLTSCRASPPISTPSRACWEAGYLGRISSLDGNRVLPKTDPAPPCATAMAAHG